MMSEPNPYSEEGVSRVDQLILARRDAFAAARDMYVTVVLGAVPRGGMGGDYYDRCRPVFVQFLNPEVLGCYGHNINGGAGAAVLQHALTATRIALLATDRHLVFPSSYMFEVSWFDQFLARVEPLVAAGHIRYTAPMRDLGEYCESKLAEYRGDRANPYRKFDLKSVAAYGQLVWMPRPGRSTAIDIGDQWKSALVPGGALHGLVRSAVRGGHRSFTKTERDMAKIPGRLGGQAFIKRFVEHLLPVPLSAADANTLAFFLSAAYLESYLTDLNAMMLVDFPLAHLSCGIQRRPDLKHRLVSAQAFDSALQLLRIHDYIHERASWDEVLKIRSSLDFSTISWAVGDGFTLGLRLAVLLARKTSHFQLATSYRQAMVNIAMVAEQLAAFIDRSAGSTHRYLAE